MRVAAFAEQPGISSPAMGRLRQLRFPPPLLHLSASLCASSPSRGGTLLNGLLEGAKAIALNVITGLPLQ